jgi:hypothetical protein
MKPEGKTNAISGGRTYKKEGLRSLVHQLQRNHWTVMTRGFPTFIVTKDEPADKPPVVFIFKRIGTPKPVAGDPLYGLSKNHRYVYWLFKDVLGLDCRIL